MKKVGKNRHIGKLKSWVKRGIFKAGSLSDLSYSISGKEALINQIWFHKYKILSVLGRGGSSDVFLAEHIKLKSPRAIKRIRKDHILHEHLLNEAYILKNLRHTCIPVIYDFEEDEQYSYIIEQHIEGQSLSQFRKQWLGKVNEKVIVDIGIQICDLLLYLYSLDNPILYLDLQPNNIIISREKVKLIDFGASVYKKEVNRRRYSLGTKGFAAPELYGSKKPSERTDIYGLGALLMFLATGGKPQLHTFLGISNKSIKSYSKKLERIIKTCLSTNPFFRYAKVEILKKQLLLLNERKSNKTRRKDESNEPISIAIGGAQSRIGVTHLSILITSYFRHIGFNSLYIEANNSYHAYKLIESQKNIKLEGGIYKVCDFNGSYSFNKSNYFNILPFYEIQLPIDIEPYKFRVIDYGVLNHEKLSDFLEADIKACILGSKEWELEQSENIFKLLNEHEEIKYLFNFIDSDKLKEINRYLKNIPCYKIPHEPDIFTNNFNDNLIKFMEELINC